MLRNVFALESGTGCESSAHQQVGDKCGCGSRAVLVLAAVALYGCRRVCAVLLVGMLCTKVKLSCAADSPPALLLCCCRGGPGASTHVEILGNEGMLNDLLRIVSGNGEGMADSTTTTIHSIAARIPWDEL